MSVNWKDLEDKLVSIIKDRRAKNEDDYAKLIADEYDRAVLLKAQDIMLANKPISTKKSSLESALKNAFKLAKATRSESEAQNIMRVFINIGIVSYWAGGQFGLTNPPPGAVSVVTNLVVFPGIPPDVKISNSSKPEEFAREFVLRVRSHALTIKLVTTGVTASGSPVVVPISGIN